LAATARLIAGAVADAGRAWQHDALPLIDEAGSGGLERRRICNTWSRDLFIVPNASYVLLVSGPTYAVAVTNHLHVSKTTRARTH